jgi:hypothetical protein
LLVSWRRSLIRTWWDLSLYLRWIESIDLEMDKNNYKN